MPDVEPVHVCEPRRPRVRWYEALALSLVAGAGFLALYLLTLTDVHTYDALSYILDVDRKPWRELFHPHHLAYGPFGALIRGLAAASGWSGSAERLLQVANAIAGALGVALFAVVARRETGQVAAGALGGLLLGASYAYWYYAVEVEVYTIAAVFLIVALGLLLPLARAPSLRLAAGLGAVQGCAVLFHQTNVLLCVPALVALLLGLGGWGAPGRARGGVALLLAYGLPLALIVGGAYLWVGLGVSGFRSWGELVAWAAGYATTGYWGGPVDSTKLPLLGAGLAGTLARPGGAVIGLGLVLVLLLRWQGLRRAPRGAVAVCAAWLLAYGAFFLWWEPDNIEFWIASLPPFYLLVLLAVWGADRWPGEGRDVGASRPWKAPAAKGKLWSLALLVGGLAMLGINGASIARRGDASRDLQRVAAAALAAYSAPGDLIVAPDGLPELYLPFYEGRPNVISLSQAMAASGDWPAACALIHGRVDETLAAGYAVLIAEDAIRPPPAPPGEPPTPAQRLGLAPEVVAACYEPLLPATEPVALGEGLPAYRRIAGAQALADGAGWDFTRGRWGWRVTGAEPAASALPGWALRPGTDPALTSPPVRLDTARYGAVELRLAADAGARDAQLFFLDGAGQADEARSIRWELQPGPGPHTYVLALRDAPGWEGVVGGLRLDPVSAGDGGTVVVQSIRLLP